MTFTLTDKTWLSDINCEALVYQHPSGMRHIHIASTFPELSFCAAFPTSTYDDTGMPHILEHMTLCGSKDYPQNDPFFSMIHRSVAHNLNAMTDRTVTSYHFATTDAKDYDNLATLYLDLIFRPLLREKDFLREGWRLEQGEDGRPKLNGIVLNEMMGAYSDGRRQMVEAMVMTLGKGTPAEKMTGGHPLAIPALDYETLKNFYYSRYFYGKSVIVTGGQIDIEQFHDRVLNTLSKIEISGPLDDPSNGAGRGKGVNPHNSLEFEATRKLENGTEVVRLTVPGEEGESNHAVWLWRADYHPGSLEELRDQLIAWCLFSNTNPAFVRLCRDTDLSWEGGLMFHGLARHSGKIGLFLMAPGVDADRIASLDARIDQFFNESVAAGLSSSAWQYHLDSVNSNIRTHKPVHELAFSMAELAVNNYPIDSDTNNLMAVQTLAELGAPDSEKLGQWLNRFDALGAIITKPDPGLMKRWQDELDEIALAKYEAGVPFTGEDELVQKDEADVLPRLKTSELDPVIDPMSAISVFPPVKATHKNIEKLRRGIHDVAAMSSMWPEGFGLEPAQEGQVNTATITHVYSPEDEKSMKLCVMFDGTELEHEDRIRLNALSEVARELGNDGMTREQTIERNMADKVRMHVSTKSKHEIPGENPWVMIFEANVVNPQGVENCADALCRSLRPNLEHADLAHALSRIRQNLLSEIEDVRRDEANTRLGASVVASNAGELQTLVGVDEFLDFLTWAKDNPAQAADQIQESLDKLNTSPRMILAVGEDNMKDQAAKAAEIFASTAPAWQNVRQAHDWKPGVSGRGHIPMSGGSHDISRYMGCPNLKKDRHKMLTMRVMANLASPYLHTEIREKGGAYGSGMYVYNHTVRLFSTDDPSPDRAYDTFSTLAQWFRNMADKPNDDLLEEARIGVARNLVRPGRGLNGLHSAIANIGRWSSVDSIPSQLANLYKVSWDDIRRGADLVDPAITPFQDVTIGPATPKPLPSKPKMRLV